MTNDDPKSLESEIEDARRQIASDGYPMSIGEITNLYRDGELVIRPEFQRLYRWSNTQKSRLIESLLLGIPLPSIFVAQSEKGIWELVDGMQRISTILELQGELHGEDGAKLPMLQLEATKFLTALEGRCWQDRDISRSLTDAQRLDIKRSKIDIKIIKRESSPEAKFDLFQRLNSYGSPLTAQETRTALIVAVSPDFLAWLQELASLDCFRNTVALNERLIEEQFDLEMVIRFIVLHNWPIANLTLTGLRDLRQILDDECVKLAKSSAAKWKTLKRVFVSTFSHIDNFAGEDAFRRWYPQKAEFKGSFLITAFEVFALGVGFHFAKKSSVREDLLECAKEFWLMPKMQGRFATGVATERRLMATIPDGRRIVALK